jgi:tRNA dimethylallyltransferase
MPPRERLHAAAQVRLDAMLSGGALAEIASLAARHLPPDLPIMKALGVPPLIAHLEGRLSLAEARTATLHATRQYQKRQSTWARSRQSQSGWPILTSQNEKLGLNILTKDIAS